MKDAELIKTIVKTYIIEKNFKFKKSNIKNLIEDSIDVKVTKIDEESYENSKILYIYYGGKRKRCLVFTIQNETIIVEQVM